MSPIELVAAALVLANVALLARRSVWNYPVALVGVALYGWIFAQAKLYSDMALQGFFFVLNVYGWAMWTRAKAVEGDVRVLVMRPRQRLGWAAGAVAATIGWAALMARFTDASLPWWDAAVAVPSVFAQAMLARRWLENWHVWIAVDALAIGLYAWKGLWVTSILYVLLLGLAGWGLLDWTRAQRAAA